MFSDGEINCTNNNEEIMYPKSILFFLPLVGSDNSPSFQGDRDVNAATWLLRTDRPISTKPKSQYGIYVNHNGLAGSPRPETQAPKYDDH